MVSLRDPRKNPSTKDEDHKFWREGSIYWIPIAQNKEDNHSFSSSRNVINVLIKIKAMYADRRTVEKIYWKLTLLPSVND